MNRPHRFYVGPAHEVVEEGGRPLESHSLGRVEHPRLLCNERRIAGTKPSRRGRVSRHAVVRLHREGMQASRTWRSGRGIQQMMVPSAVVLEILEVVARSSDSGIAYFECGDGVVRSDQVAQIHWFVR